MTAFTGLLVLLAAAQPVQPEDGRLADMRRRATELRASVPDGDGRAPLAVVAKPLLRFNDPARETTDGSIWAIGESGRPRALLSLFLEPDGDGPGKWSYEFVELGTPGLEVRSPKDWAWTPRTTPFVMRELPDAGKPASTPGPRMTQMKLLARRFEVIEKFFAEEYRLKLKPQPIHRYADPEAGLVDGAMFVCSHGTNPEVLLVLECRRKDGADTWRYGFARLSAADVSARLGDKVVWTRAHVPKSVPDDPYFIQFVQDEPSPR